MGSVPIDLNANKNYDTSKRDNSIRDMFTPASRVCSLTKILDELYKVDWHIRCKLQPNGFDCTKNESMSYR